MNIIIAIIILSIIVIIHEFGHFIVARANGIAVSEFALGLGPTILKFKKKGTLFSLKLLPFGGACIMAGEDESEDGISELDKDKLFTSKSVWRRISVIAAGPIFNFLLAFIMAVFIIGSIGYDPCKLYSVTEGSAAEEAGLQAGDVITSVNGKRIHFYKEYSLYYQLHTGKTLNITYERDGAKYETTVVPRYIEEDVYQLGVYLGENAVISGLTQTGAAALAGFKTNDQIIQVNGVAIKSTDEAIQAIRSCGGGKINVAVFRDGEVVDLTVTPVLNHNSYYETGMSFSAARVKVNPIQTLKYSAIEVKYWINTVFESLKMLFTGKVTKDDVAGPVGIVSAISDVVEQSKPDGVFYVILNLANWVVMISANLGVMNLLPIPALDGGRLLFLLIEAVRGKPVDQKKEGLVHLIGMALLMILMFFILFNDITKLF